MSIRQLNVKALVFCVLLATQYGCTFIDQKLPTVPQRQHVDEVTVAFYNCENLFDTRHEQGKQDRDFTPEGKYHYTQYVYEQKLHNIATVLQSMNTHDELAIAGLAEIENDDVLKDLCAQPEIAAAHYNHICHAGPDPRGINVALIYNPSLFTVIKEEIIPVIFVNGAHTRDILHVYGILAGDSVHVFVNHWTSRRGGEEESERKRVTAAQVNKDAINALMKDNKNCRVIVMGDLNDNPTDYSISNTLAAKDKKEGTNNMSLYNPFTDIYNAGEGTEKYKGQWNLFDQIILSGALLTTQQQHLHYSRAEIYHPDFLIDAHKKRSGEPHRSFAGSRWINGYSDHFPVRVVLSK